MRIGTFIFAWLISWQLANQAVASEVLQVATQGSDFIISHEGSGPWRVGDSACAVRGGIPVACGYVSEVASGGALVKTALVRRKLIDIAPGPNGAAPTEQQVIYDELKPAVGDGAQPSRVLNLDEAGALYPIAGVNQRQTQAQVKPLSDRYWSVNESICFTRAGDTIACGYITQTATSGALVQLSLTRTNVAKIEMRKREDGTSYAHVVMGREPLVRTGDGAPPSSAAPATAVAPSAASTPEASAPIDAKAAPEESAPNAMGNVSLGFDYTSPTLFFQYALSPSISAGVAMQLVDYPSSKGGGTVRGTGALISINYYADSYYRGIWLQAAAGLYSLKAEKLGAELKASSLDLQAAFGWRWVFPNGMNMGFAVGANYASPAKIKPLIEDFSGILPALILDIGFTL